MIKKSRVFEFSKNSKNEQTGFIKPRFLSHMLPFLSVHALKMQHINMIASNKSCCIIFNHESSCCVLLESRF